MIPLDSPEWRELRDAYGSAAHIPEILRRLALGTASIAELYDAFALIDRGAATDGALAVVPHVWAIAAPEPPPRRHDLLTFIGRVAYAAGGSVEDGALIAAAARADLAATSPEDVLDLVLATLAIEGRPIMYDTSRNARSGDQRTALFASSSVSTRAIRRRLRYGSTLRLSGQALVLTPRARRVL